MQKGVGLAGNAFLSADCTYALKCGAGYANVALALGKQLGYGKFNIVNISCKPWLFRHNYNGNVFYREVYFLEKRNHAL